MNHEDILKYLSVAKNYPTESAEACRWAVVSKDDSFIYMAAKHDACPEDLFPFFLSHTDAEIRLAVLDRSEAPRFVFEALSADSSERVRHHALTHDACPADIVAKAKAELESRIYEMSDFEFDTLMKIRNRV